MTLKGFPKRYEGAPEPVGDKWLQFFDSANEMITNGGITLLYGGHGTGKTRMAYELAKVCKPPRPTFLVRGITKSLPAIYTTAVNMFMDIRETYGSKSERSEKQIVSELSEAALLVIDEIQERGETQFEDRKLTQIIDARYMDGRPTILISNYSRQDFAKTLSPAVLDRIRENGKGMHFDWPSHRK
jgi:DNA replication protein DnaC